jgi:hypothetical protein
MPDTWILVSASFTSSTLLGRTIALTNCMTAPR